MKIIGLIGGISWVSTIDYYRHINEGINEKLGGLNFSQCIIYSFNYADIIKNNNNNDWDKTFDMLSEAALHLKNSGAEAIVLCANTMHKLADKIQERTGLRVIHVASATAEAIRKKEINKVGLLGTKFTMQENFFKEKLTQHNIDCIIPEEEDRIFIHDTISLELGKGILKEETKQRYLEIIQRLVDKGAQGIILGCTEIPLLIKQEDLTTTVFDTTLIHSQAAVNFSLS